MGLENNLLPIEIATHIMKKILSGELEPGSRLTEADFANTFSVSNIPVREAFYILQSSGLIEKIPRKGVRVKANTAKEIHDYKEALMDLFRIALKKSEGKWTEECVETLTNQLDITTKSLVFRNNVQYLAELTKLLKVLFDVANNNAITRFYIEVSNVTTAYCQSIWNNFDHVIDWHTQYVVGFVEALQNKDLQLAKENLKQLNEKAFTL